ncbi:hypothetical protein [Bradyrhizobium sp. BWA-3-5]|uniref:hypothetical protein n=1 Tax=Bradyrhizobium sp. BWA-3-5 TaxID=3080013 RepID=UPI00293F556E|nr:hypothetical protein [Bradyrhizobium sp. BWA-3-5]WOH67211.1 hypothetical protein RX331_05480 [Bradyrhizobium sp. BWA-3-5]
MKLFTGSLVAGLVLLAGGAQAQVPGPHERSPYVAASDFDAAVAPPMVRGPRYAPGPDYVPGPQYGYAPGPGLLPSTEVYSVLRDNGFSPLGIPRLRGFVYTISALDRGGEDGRLVIDARNGRIIRFVPYRTGDNFYEDQSALGSPSMGPVPQAHAPGQAAIQAPAQGSPQASAQNPVHVQAAPRAPKPAAQVASRSVPVPKASPIAAKPAQAPVQQAAAPVPKPTEAQAAATAPAVTGTVPAKPEPKIAPTQDMPNAQGLE